MENFIKFEGNEHKVSITCFDTHIMIEVPRNLYEKHPVFWNILLEKLEQIDDTGDDISAL